ncbi:hypothetical protein INT46_006337, partial [Mucor plumbeus]
YVIPLHEEHLDHLKQIFDRMIEVNMKLNPNKYVLFKNKLDFLGFEVSTKDISPIKSKVEAILQTNAPKDKTGVRAFINMIGFYRRHIPQFAQRTFALTNLLKKNAAFIWESGHQIEFEGLTETLANAAMLVYPDSTKPYSVYCVASDTGIAAVLCQTDNNGNDVPVCFISRKLKSAEINYPIVEKEFLAIVYALYKLRRYLLDQKFTVYTDNMTAKYLFTKKEPNTRLQRWCLALQEYDFEIKHVAGTRNPSDYCSRYPLSPVDEEAGEEILEQLFSAMVILENYEKLDYEPELKEIYACLARVGSVELNFKDIRSLELKATKYMVGNNCHIYRQIGSKKNPRRYVKIPFISERHGILTEVHDGHGHFGVHSTRSILYRNYWWPRVYDEMKNFLRSCHACQLFSPAPHMRSLHNGKTQNVLGIFQQFSIDYVGPLPESKLGSKYVLVCTEMFTRWPMAVATKKADAITAATFLYEEVFTKFGPITTILSDNGSHFANQVLEEYVALCNARHKFGTPYHPENQVMV